MGTRDLNDIKEEADGFTVVFKMDCDSDVGLVVW